MSTEVVYLSAGMAGATWNCCRLNANSTYLSSPVCEIFGALSVYKRRVCERRKQGEWMKSINTCSCDRSVDSFVSEWKALTHVIDWLTASLPEVSGLSPTDTKVDPEWKGWFLLSTSCTVSAFCWPQDCPVLQPVDFRSVLSCCLSMCSVAVTFCVLPVIVVLLSVSVLYLLSVTFCPLLVIVVMLSVSVLCCSHLLCTLLIVVTC